jgi:hypothetical protein
MTATVTGATSGSYSLSATPANGTTTGSAAKASLRVLKVPVATMTMDDNAARSTDFYQLTIDNPNDVAIPGVSFSTVSDDNPNVHFGGDTTACGAETTIDNYTVPPGSSWGTELAGPVTISGITLPAGGSCIFQFEISPDINVPLRTSAFGTPYGLVFASFTTSDPPQSVDTPSPAPHASLVTVDTTPSPSPTPTASSLAAPSGTPSPHPTPGPAAPAPSGPAGPGFLLLVGLGGIAVVAAVAGLLALVWRRRRTPAVEVMYQRMGKVSRGALPFLAAGALVLGAAALVLAAGASLSKIAVTGTPSGSHTVSASPSNSGAAGASANSSETNAPVVTMKVTPDPEGEDGQAWLTIAIENTNEDEDIHGVSFTLTGPENLQVAPGEVSPQCGGPDVMRGSTSQEVTVTRATVPAHTTCSFTMLITVDYHGDYTFSTGPIGSGYGSSPGVSGTFELPVAEATATPTAAPAAATTGGDSGLPTAALGVGGLALLGLGGVLTLVWRRRRTPAKEVV